MYIKGARTSFKFHICLIMSKSNSFDAVQKAVHTDNAMVFNYPVPETLPGKLTPTSVLAKRELATALCVCSETALQGNSLCTK